MIQKRKPLHVIEQYVNNTSLLYNINKKNIVKDFLNFIIRKKQHIMSSEFLNFIENIMHFDDCKHNFYVNYSLTNLLSFIPKEI